MNVYKFIGLPLTPSMIESLIVDLFNGKTVKRDEIVNRVLDFHLLNGGLKPEATDYSRSVKTALTYLQEKSFATNRSYGMWAISKSDMPVEISEQFTIEDKIAEIPSHITYGKGQFAVYLYYFPNYKELAILMGKNTWPCKIGRTDRDPLIRILSQASTALPEPPTIEFIIRTDDSSLLETTIHSILTIRKQHIKDSPGIEWFDTNPEEVISIIKYVSPELLI